MGEVTEGGKAQNRKGNLTVTCGFWAHKSLAFLRRREGDHAVKCQQVVFKK